MSRFFFVAGLLLVLGGAYFAFDLFSGEPEVAEIIVYPIYIGFAGIGAVISFILALISYLLRRRRRG